MSTRTILAGHIVSDTISVSSGVLAVQEEGTTVGTFSTLNFVGTSVTASDVGGVATIALAAPTLTAVLTAGNDGGGLDVVNIGALTFDTATATKGIAIGTDAAPATTSHPTSIAIGSTATVLSPNSLAVGAEIEVGAASQYAVLIGYASLFNSAVRGISVGSSTTQTGGGQYNITIGYYCTTAAGSHNIVMGRNENVYSTSQNNILFGRGGSIMGSNNVVFGDASYILGSGTNCVALGNRTKSVAGSRNISIGKYAYNIGTGASNNNIAMGSYAYCQGVATSKSISIGNQAKSAHSNAIVIGSNRTSSAANQMTLGTTATHFRTAFVLDNTAPPAGAVVLPNATTMWSVTLNGVPYYMPLFAPPP